MKRSFLLAALLLLSVTTFAQTSTEIYVFDLEETDGVISISNPINISQGSPGYDNQPAFTEDGLLLYAATRNGQTDVVAVNLETGERKWLTDTPGGGEYSPTPVSGGFSAIRLDTTGFQRLYLYDYPTGKSEILVDDVVIGYHAWLDEKHIATFVLDEPPTLQVCNIETDQCEVLAEKIGRSLHRIPGTDLLSYIDKSADTWTVRSMNPLTGESAPIITTLPGSEDVAWAPGAVLFSGHESKVYAFNPVTDNEWQLVADLSEFGLSGVTRLAVHPAGERIAVVVNQ